ncbi:PTS system N-acetylgalactosamine-specific EIID component, Man family [Clostridium cavendishii DSM 21758]|uniref:PTS system N-acetylgalactosamine-specific EIID component, Man family n=1 Tax=Clostridium cavendishii DSM 21758 TaxID=1121302 RepID=A0A1M6H3Q8_9CLOT|nr:PTS system mannose/fructose/sorbose family transporter subunit IID [Clostridium cavendishii]SHJ16814.1 PTS system N-acetylgalactosamine-specific EIID component, Man family [Clostridium cavendishii DSM 21758]
MESKNVSSNEITKKDLNKMVWRSTLLQASFNYERYQGAGWLYGMLPALRKIHTNKDDLAVAMKDHAEFFNTHPVLVTFIMGIITAMEKGKIDRDSIRSIKVSLMGPLGGIGDSLIWMTALSICASIGVSLSAKTGSIAGPILFLVLFNAIHFGLRFGLMKYGYKKGIEAVGQFKDQIKKITHAASIVGITILGAMASTFVKLKIIAEPQIGDGSKILIQKDILDKVLANALPVAYVFFMLYLLKKGKSPLFLIILTFVLAVLGHAAMII